MVTKGFEVDAGNNFAEQPTRRGGAGYDAYLGAMSVGDVSRRVLSLGPASS
jgi:hypothetical protein